jgi:hypothetical protein
MSPEAKDLAAAYYREALAYGVSVSVRFPGDRDMAASVVGSALCEAAIQWTLSDRSHPFARFMRVVIQRRIYDEWRATYGRRLGAARRRGYFIESLSEFVVGMRDTPLSDLVAGDYDLRFDTAESEADAPWFRDRLKNLTEQEYEIIELLADGYTLREVGDFIGVTESRVCQIRGDIRGKFLRSARTDVIVMRGKQLPLYNRSA